MVTGTKEGLDKSLNHSLNRLADVKQQNEFLTQLTVLQKRASQTVHIS